MIWRTLKGDGLGNLMPLQDEKVSQKQGIGNALLFPVAGVNLQSHPKHLVHIYDKQLNIYFMLIHVTYYYILYVLFNCILCLYL